MPKHSTSRRPHRLRRNLLRALLITVLVVGAGGWLYREYVYSPVIFGLRDDFVHAVPNQTVPEGLTSLSSEECGTCHTDIYNEWQTSIHAHAWKDPYFQAYWEKDRQIWICLNCHTPLENQQPSLVKGLKRDKIDRPILEDNPLYDPSLREEGITCAACHVRDGVIYGPYEDSQAPHPTAHDPKYRTTEICYWCHQVPSGPFQFYNGGPCATFFEFEDGPYAKQGFTCQTCHMPAAERPAANDGPVRDTRRHLWRGGHSPEMLNQALQVQLTADRETWSEGEDVTFTLHLTNGGAGHKIPTGDPDRRFTITFVEQDEDGHTVHDDTRTIGRWLIWKPIIVELYGNRIPPLESRDYRFKAEAKAGHTLKAVVRYHIVTERAKAKLIKKYGLPPETPHVFTLYERTVDLGSGTLEPPANTAALQCVHPHPA